MVAPKLSGLGLAPKNPKCFISQRAPLYLTHLSLIDFFRCDSRQFHNYKSYFNLTERESHSYMFATCLLRREDDGRRSELWEDWWSEDMMRWWWWWCPEVYKDGSLASTENKSLLNTYIFFIIHTEKIIHNILLSHPLHWIEWLKSSIRVTKPNTNSSW